MRAMPMTMAGFHPSDRAASTIARLNVEPSKRELDRFGRPEDLFFLERLKNVTNLEITEIL